MTSHVLNLSFNTKWHCTHLSKVAADAKEWIAYQSSVAGHEGHCKLFHCFDSSWASMLWPTQDRHMCECLWSHSLVRGTEENRLSFKVSRHELHSLVAFPSRRSSSSTHGAPTFFVRLRRELNGALRCRLMRRDRRRLFESSSSEWSAGSCLTRLADMNRAAIFDPGLAFSESSGP